MDLCEVRTEKTVRVVFLFVILLAAAGILASKLRLGYLPGKVKPSVSVTVEWRGAFEEEVERGLTIPLENALAELPGLEELFSLSERGRCRIYLRFGEEIDLGGAYLDVREAVDGIRDALPEASQRPVLAKSGVDDGPVFIAAFGPDCGKSKDELERLFEGIEGTGEVEAGGGSKRELMIEADVRKAGAAGLSLFSVLEAERAANLIGSFGEAGGTPRVFDHRLAAPEDFGRVPLGKGLRLRDLADASYAAAARDTVSIVDGGEKILLYIRAAGDANPLLLSERLKRLTASVPDSRVLYDYGALVKKALSQIAAALFLGAALVVLFTFLFTRSVPAALFTALSIPFSCVVTLAVLAAAGFDLDVMSLAGIAAGSGLLVTSGILFGEDYLRLGRDSRKARRSAGEPIVYSALTTACVFLPLLFAPRGLKDAYGGLALAVAAVLAASLLYVFLFMPAFLDGWFRGKPEAPAPGPEPAYSLLAGRAVLFISAHRPAVIAGLVLLGGGSAFLASGLAFREPDFEGKPSLRLVLEYPSGTSLERVESSARGVDDALRAAPGVKSASAKFEKERAVFDAELDRAEVRPAVEEAAGKAAREIGEAFLHVPEPGGDRESFEVVLAGPKTGELRKTAEDLASELRAAAGVRGVVLHFKEALPSKRLLFDPVTAVRLGVEPARAASLLRWAFSSPVADKIVFGSEEVDLRLGAAGAEPVRAADFLGFPAPGPEGPVGIGEFAAMDEKEEIGRIYRLNRRRSASLTVITDAGTRGEAIRAAREAVGRRPLPEDCTAEAAGDEKRRGKDFRETLLVFLLALCSVALVLLFEFESPGIPLFILAQLPFILALPAGLLRVMGLPLASPAVVGLVLCAGIGVNDSLLLFDRNTDRPFDPERLARVFRERFRAILASTLSAAAGVLPLLFSGAAGTGVLAPLSLVMAAGTLWAPFVLAAFIAIIPARE